MWLGPTTRVFPTRGGLADGGARDLQEHSAAVLKARWVAGSVSFPVAYSMAWKEVELAGIAPCAAWLG